jgi:hypothetical protein
VRDQLERAPADLARAMVLPLLSRVAAALGFSRVSIEQPGDIPSDIEDLVAATARLVRSRHPRSADFLRVRWFGAPDTTWNFATARDQRGRLKGFIVFGPDLEPPEGTASVRGTVVDLLAVDAAATTALLRHAWRFLRAEGCDVVAFDHLDPRPWSRGADLRAGFFPVEAGPLVTVDEPDGPGGQDPVFWHLTSGDIDRT